MLRSLTSHATVRYGTRSFAKPLELLSLTILSLAAVVWVLSLMGGQRAVEREEYELLLGAYGIAAASFVIPRVKANLSRFFELPVFITVVAFLRFGLVPLYFFVYPELRLHGYLVDAGLFRKTLFYLAVGMVAFWLGSTFVRPTQSMKGDAVVADMAKDPRPLVCAIVLYLAATATKLYLLYEHLYSYTASLDAYYQNLAWMQVLVVITQFGTVALGIATLETYCHPRDRRRMMLFSVLLASECFWGLLSGMKTLLLQNFVLVALVSSLVQRRLRVKWLVTPLLLLVLIYPLHNQYRNLIRGGGQDVASLGSASSVGMLALTNAMEQKQSMGSWLGSGFDSSLDRLDILQSIADVVYLGPWLDSIRTRDHWWMVGFYPFIPRLLWPSKPVENMGNAFAVKLQEDPNSCAAITYPGDAYLEFGLLGIMVGMFVLGAYCEWLTRFGIRTLSKRRFFVYVSMFLISADLEQDVFAYWTGAIRYLVVFGAVAWLVYRPRGLSSRFLFRRQEQAFEGSSS